jgi:hypothetical protein
MWTMRVSQAVTKIKQAFANSQNALTITDLRTIYPELKSSQISMSLCYLMRARWVTRNQVESGIKRGHKMIWSYTYHQERLPKV